jgi:hypothetical protein
LVWQGAAVSIEPEQPGWAGVAIGAGLALAAVAALSIVGVIAQGFAVSDRTGVAYKLGIAFLRNLDATPVGIMALVAVALVAAPSLAGAVITVRQRQAVAATFAIVLAVCLVVVFGSVLGVVTRLHFDKDLDAATRRVLATFVVRSMGPAIVAFGAALALVPRLPRPVTPPPYAEDGGTEPEPGAGAGPP